MQPRCDILVVMYHYHKYYRSYIYHTLCNGHGHQLNADGARRLAPPCSGCLRLLPATHWAALLGPHRPTWTSAAGATGIFCLAPRKWEGVTFDEICYR